MHDSDVCVAVAQQLDGLVRFVLEDLDHKFRVYAAELTHRGQALAHKGRKIFDGSDERGLRRLELLDTSRTDAGSLLLWYRFASA
ncbi:MAG: hypothetical protein ACRDY6_12295 [Acidimicrobiia bacterium]